MKTWIFTILGLVIFIILGLINQSSLEKNTKRLAIKMHRVETTIQQKNWPEAGRGLEAIRKNWRKIKPTWSLLLHHREIDAIDQAIIRTQRAIQSHDNTIARIEHGSLGEYIEHIPKREEFSLVNIL